MHGLRQVLREAWRLASPYFMTSGERWPARLMLGSVIGLNLLSVGGDVLLNNWRGLFYNSLQEKDSGSFVNLLLTWQPTESGVMPGFVPIVTVLVLITIYSTYITQILQIRWRRWFVWQLAQGYLTGRAYYAMGLSGNSNADNPDQRIADDTNLFVEKTLTLGLDLLSTAVSFVSFSVILWTLSSALQVFGLNIPGFLLWVTLLYAAIGTWLTHRVGKPLVDLEFNQQRVEANFRFALVRLRENTEGVALMGGEAQESAVLAKRFGGVFGNWVLLSRRKKWVNALVQGYAQAAVIFPFVIAAPQYFLSATMKLGDLMRIVGAFSQVQVSISWFVNQYQSLAAWRATVTRLTGFQDAVAAAHASGATGLRAVPGSDLALADVTVRLPGGATVLDTPLITFARGRSTVITGRSGSGKSTLFRVLAGIWPFATGVLRQPEGSRLFLPQRPYIPLGTLREALSYPQPPDHYADAEVATALQDVGLGGLVAELDAEDNWGQRLSGGEQQRLAVARALLLRPAWLFMDEATASLDPEAEDELYALLRRKLPSSTVISIAHRPAVAAFHDDQRVFRRNPGETGHLDPAPAQPVAAK